MYLSLNNISHLVTEMEDKDLDSHTMRSNNYTKLLNAFDNPLLHMNKEITEQILDICMTDLTCDLQYSSSALTITSHILKKIKEKRCECSSQKLLQSAITILNFKKKLNSKPFLRKQSVEVFLSYPEETLIGVTEHSGDFFELMVHFPLSFETGVMKWECQIVAKLLEILPPEKKVMFVSQGLDVWFRTILPGTIYYVSKAEPEVDQCLSVLELLTDCLKQIDYSTNASWEIVLQDICNPNKYTMVLKAALQGNYWHRLWKILITLLKDQITKVNASNVSPINALLPVVEQAFKMDVTCRCLAFDCWNVLIDNFATELNEALINKRLKLLMIPLKLNNAKVEETVLAKLNTWWHLIRRFHSKMEKLTDTVLIPFLHFCFGKPDPVRNAGRNISVIPGQMTSVISVKCIEVLVEIVGHTDCSGCCTLPNAGGRLISTKLLAEHWSLWIYCLQTAIKTAAANYNDNVVKQITCLWKGFIMIIGELPENQIRADLVLELLDSVESLLALCEHHDKIADIIYDVLIISLFVDDPKVRQLLKSNEEEGPMVTILRIIQNPSMDSYFARSGEILEEKVNKLKPITAHLVNLNLYVDTGNRHDLWAALVESYYESKCIYAESANLILGPVRNMSCQSQEYAADLWFRWYKLYIYLCQIINPARRREIRREILSVLTENNYQPSNVYFRLFASMALLKETLLKNVHKFETDARLLLDTLRDTNNLESIDTYFPELTDTLQLLWSYILSITPPSAQVKASDVAVLLLQETFKQLNIYMKKNKDAQKPTFVDILLKNSRRFLTNINKTLSTLNECDNNFESFKSVIASTFKLIAEVTHTTANKSAISKSNPKLDSNEEAIEIFDLTEQLPESNKNDFPPPEPKSAKKTKTNKKEPNIVNTVVENGEEFVVVKSHWKFNPKKLTEHQKEKLKRKREDIPALYQDLSQSQDDSQLKTWKTDSQDATTSNSDTNSKSNGDIATVLQKLPSTDLVPKIIDNIFNDAFSKINEEPKENLDNNILNDNNNKVVQKTPAPKSPKIPRLALKDRVSRNVKNLIEQSRLPGESGVTQGSDGLNRTINENDLKTPISQSKKKPSLISSAPPKIMSEKRPSRSIKIPKKFEDTELLTLKKRRRSHSGEKSSNKTEEAPKESIPNVDDSNLAKQNCGISDNQENSGISNNQTEINVNYDKTKVGNKIVDIDKTPVEVVLTQEPRGESSITNDDISSQVDEISSPKHDKTKQRDEDQSTKNKKRSRIEKQLLIDMVEGHPVLQQPESRNEKRVTRKNVTNETNDTVSKKRKSLIEKSNKIKADLVSAGMVEISQTDNTDKHGSKSSPKPSNPKSGNQKILNVVADVEAESLSQTVIVLNSQDLSSDSQDLPMSEDVIESSQDSSFTTISIKSATKKKVPIVCLDKENACYKSSDTETQDLINYSQSVIPQSDNSNINFNLRAIDDIELPKNKTMLEENVEQDLTENMDTEPMDSSGEVVILNDDLATPIVINTEETVIGKETQELAEADTLPMDVESECSLSLMEKNTVNDVNRVPSQENLITPTLSGRPEVITDIIVESSNTGSPIKDDVQRKKEFLNDTIDISPIKTLSPVRENKSPSPETSSDCVVIKLTTPVQSDGEPFNDKCNSPEVFTEDKLSPEKNDQSPPRKEIVRTNSSPSSSLSLKKNRPQMRYNNGRAAQMLGLCVPENPQIAYTERSDVEERKTSPVSTPARRNLKRFYAGEENENQGNETESEDIENCFLKFTRPLPTAESSPCNPILKRKLADISDESTVSPASKRKRVSFHDPPVSTTVAVQKYIEPCGVRSPSNSTIKRQERQLRALTHAKSAKRLENTFKLETVLTKAVESFTDENTISNDTVMSLDETPAAEVVQTSELNDTDPICPELIDCNDPIENIAGDLSSPSTKALFTKELAGKVETIADLAKMTELEVNRLCIKAPKVKTAKKVLNKYSSERAKPQEILTKAKSKEMTVISHSPIDIMPVPVAQIKTNNIEVQTNEVSTKNRKVQTIEVPKVFGHTQTDKLPTSHGSSQTNETGSKSTKDVISTCLNERSDFVDQLAVQLPLDDCVSLLLNKMTASNSTEVLNQRSDFVEQLAIQLQHSSIRRISEQLPLDDCLSLLLNKMTASNSTEVLNQVISHTTNYTTKESTGMDLNILQEFLCKRYDLNDLPLFFSLIFKKFHEKKNPSLGD